MLPASSFLFSLSFLLLASICPTSSLASSCRKNEAAALLEIRRTLSNPLFLNSWNESPDCCTWIGVKCDPVSGRVVELYLQSADISGPIPLSITRLSSLRTLVISDAKVTGTIPPSIGGLTNLTTLTISDCPHVTGAIPTTLCNLRNLAELTLSYNKLVGPIPGCFGKTLARIDLSGNRLSDHIPANIMRGVAATSPSPRLYLSQNRLTGPIPPALGDVPLKFVDLSYNRLAGDASFFFKEKGSLEEIYLRGNELEFDLSKVRFPLRMRALSLRRNKIYGSIPQQITRLGMLNVLNLSRNRLCGPIPTAGVMNKFDASSFEHNKCLCGGPLKPCH